MHIPKANCGEHFTNLDMLTSLLARRKDAAKAKAVGVEVLSSSDNQLGEQVEELETVTNVQGENDFQSDGTFASNAWLPVRFTLLVGLVSVS